MSNSPVVPRPKRVPVSFFTDGEMIALAASRAQVELLDGRAVTLIRWVTPRRTSQARVQFFSGSLLTVKKRDVVAVYLQDASSVVPTHSQTPPTRKIIT
jgi:hypothetical protein